MAAGAIVFTNADSVNKGVIRLNGENLEIESPADGCTKVDGQCVAQQSVALEAKVAALTAELDALRNKAPSKCRTGDHSCDKTIYGNCYEVADGKLDHSCGCKAGYWSQTAQDNLHACFKHSECTATQHEALSPSETRDRICQENTVCTGTEWEKTKPTTLSNRVCAAHTVCDSKQWQFKASTATADRECLSISVCAASQWQTAAPTATADRVCRALTECSAAEWESTPPAALADRVCTPITAAPTPAPSPGCVDDVSFYVPEKNECTPCADNCGTGQYRFGCGHSAAGQCVACSTPKAHAHHAGSGSHGQAGSCREECDAGYHAHGGACIAVTPNPTPAPTPSPTIHITYAHYGRNCGGSRQTHNLGAACNNRRSCYYKVDHNRIGDPAGGCAKDYPYSWCCMSGSRQISCHSGRVPPEASFRPGFHISC